MDSKHLDSMEKMKKRKEVKFEKAKICLFAVTI